MVDTILVPVDDTPESERAVPVGAAIAAALGAAVELVTVESPRTDASGTATYQAMLREDLPASITTRSTVLYADGPVADAIVDLNRSRTGSIVCMATRAVGPVAELVLGSTADRLLRGAGAPVLLVGPACDPGWPGGALAGRRLVAAVDGSAFDDAVTDAALAWRAALDLELTFVTAAAEHPAPGEPAPAVDALARAAARAEAAGRPATTRLLHGVDAGADIASHLRDEPAALLVVGSHRRGPWARMALGAHALWLVHRVACPVLVAGTPAGCERG